MSIIQFSEVSSLSKDKDFIIGCDEVGYGSLAGPVTVCGVRAEPGWNLKGLNDSKKLSPKRRAAMRDKLLELSQKKEICFHIADRNNEYIDQYGIAFALKNAYIEVFHKLHQLGSLIITDGILKFDTPEVSGYHITSLVKADTLVPVVMAASILAKTHRDELMILAHKDHPQFDWISNMGYGATKHLQALSKFGPCKLHRKSYAPMKNMNKVI